MYKKIPVITRSMADATTNSKDYRKLFIIGNLTVQTYIDKQMPLKRDDEFYIDFKKRVVLQASGKEHAIGPKEKYKAIEFCSFPPHLNDLKGRHMISLGEGSEEAMETHDTPFLLGKIFSNVFITNRGFWYSLGFNDDKHGWPYTISTDFGKGEDEIGTAEKLCAERHKPDFTQEKTGTVIRIEPGDNGYISLIGRCPHDFEIPFGRSKPAKAIDVWAEDSIKLPVERASVSLNPSYFPPEIVKALGKKRVSDLFKL
ncbi:MAG: hypothetical protein V3U72_01335 [Candidatus Aenigmarchaeota archaeon]